MTRPRRAKRILGQAPIGLDRVIVTGFRLPLLLALLCVLTPAVSYGLRATVGLEYDDNPFETRTENRRSGWINRFFLFSSARLKQSNRHVIQVRHQWGLKRFWKSEMANGAHGDVVASQLDLGGIVQLNDRYTASWGTDVKIKNVQRVSSEESYLRGNLRLRLVARLDDRSVRHAATPSIRRGIPVFAPGRDRGRRVPPDSLVVQVGAAVERGVRTVRTVPTRPQRIPPGRRGIPEEYLFADRGRVALIRSVGGCRGMAPDQHIRLTPMHLDRTGSGSSQQFL